MTGEWEGERGTGKIQYTDGSSYQGEFRNEKKDGTGTYTFPSGNKYTGQYKVSISLICTVPLH